MYSLFSWDLCGKLSHVENFTVNTKWFIGFLLLHCLNLVSGPSAVFSTFIQSVDSSRQHGDSYRPTINNKKIQITNQPNFTLNLNPEIPLILGLNTSMIFPIIKASA
jgi:hypothetical protein